MTLGHVTIKYLQILHTVEPRLMDAPTMWTPHHYGHFSQGPFSFPYTMVHNLAGVDTGWFSENSNCGHPIIVDTFCPALQCSH